MAKKKDDSLLTKKSFLKEWLEKLQQESWQLELLISGFALFGIYESRALVADFILHLSSTDYSAGNVLMASLGLIIRSGWLIFFINLLVHVILRGLWIGAIGLRYVSQDIDYDNLDYSTTFTKFLKKRVGEYDDFIERLEKICSVLFAYTFLLFLLLVSLILYFGILGFVLVLGAKYGEAGQAHPASILFMTVYLLLGIFVFIDFITLGALKKVESKSFSRFYLVIFSIFSFITLSFLYRPLLYNFIDNKYTRRLFFLSVPYIFIVIFSNKLISNDLYPYWSGKDTNEHGYYISKMTYEDERQKWYSENDLKRENKINKLSPITLSQFIVDQPYLEIFIKMEGDDQYMLQKMDDIKPFTKPGFRFSLFSGSEYDDEDKKKLKEEKLLFTKGIRKKRKDMIKERVKKRDKQLHSQSLDSLETLLDSINVEWKKKEVAFEENKQKRITQAMLDHVQLNIDETPINDSLDCFYYKHPNFGEFGFLCLYETASLSNGKHLLSVKRDYYHSQFDTINVRHQKIPFFVAK